MVEEHGAGDATASSRLDEHKLSGFIYGTVTGMVAIAGLSGGREVSWLEAAVVIVVGAVVTWVAHAYSALFSKRVVAEHRLDAHELGETLVGSWQIVSAGGILAIPLLPVAVGLWSLGFALRVASLTGVTILALVGIFAGVVTKETWPRRVLLAVFSAGLGLAVVAVEFVLYR